MRLVIATPDTMFQDKPHFAFSIGDGIGSLWLAVIDPIRGRTCVLLQQIIDAKEARELCVVSEIVPRDRLLSRAHEIADQITKLPPLTASYTRPVLTQKLRAYVDDTDWRWKVFPRLTWRGWQPLVSDGLRVGNVSSRSRAASMSVVERLSCSGHKLGRGLL